MDCIHVTVRNSKCYNVAEITFCTKASSKSGVQQLHMYQLDWNWDSNRYSDWYRNAIYVELDGRIMWNANNTVLGSKRFAVYANM